MKISKEEILCINALAMVSGVNARDCLINEKIISFLVREDDMARAIGKNASNVRKLQEKIKKKIEILALCSNAEQFMRKALYDIKINDVNVREENGKKAILISLDSENKRKFLNSIARFRRIKTLAMRNYNVNAVKVR